MRTLFSSTAVLVVLLILGGCARFSYVEHRRGYKHLKKPYVRVKIMETGKLSVDSRGPCELYCILPDGSTTDYFSNADVIARIEGGYISVKQASGLPLESRVTRLVVVPHEEHFYLSLNGEQFRGIADIIVEGDSLSVVNAIYIEDYLKGVLPPEIGKHGKPELEALKAQAVASRTYALSRFRVNPTKPYDMVNQVADQLYIGMSIEDRWTNRAIDATHGEVLLSNGELITAYYHSTCGGATDKIEDIWDKQSRSYLKGHDDDLYCSWSKYYDWLFTWSRSELEWSISEYLRGKGRLEKDTIRLIDFKIIDRLPSGRIKLLEIHTDQGVFLVFKDKIRWALMRPDRKDAILPSTNFHLDIERGSDGGITLIEARGRGNGHGVGMCQCGALGRSRAGQKYRYILGVYYAGSLLTRVY